MLLLSWFGFVDAIHPAGYGRAAEEHEGQFKRQREKSGCPSFIVPSSTSRLEQGLINLYIPSFLFVSSYHRK